MLRHCNALALTRISLISVWRRNYIHHKVWHEIAYPFQNLDGCNRVWCYHPAVEIVPDSSTVVTKVIIVMMTSSNGNIFRVTGPLCGEFPGHRWIPRTKASDTEFWFFLWSAPEKRLSKQSLGSDLRRHRAHYDINIMSRWDWLQQVQSSAVITRSNIVRYYIKITGTEA